MKGAVFSVDNTAAVKIADGAGTNALQRRTVAIRRITAASKLWLGASDVQNDGTATAANSAGFPLDDTYSLVSLDLDPGESLWAIADSGSSAIEVRVLRNIA